MPILEIHLAVQDITRTMVLILNTMGVGTEDGSGLENTIYLSIE